jgi:hypothetical protein
MRNILLLLTIGTVITACTKTEKIIETSTAPTLEQRQASPNVKESFVKASGTTLTLKKKALGKAFLLIANSKSTTQQPQWTEHPVKIVSFEKAGGSVGLFDIGYDRAYGSLNAEKLLQTYHVVAENADDISIDIEKGLSLTGTDQTDETMKKDPIETYLKQQGIEDSKQMIDAFVKKTDIEGNALVVYQASRFRVNVETSRNIRVAKVDSEMKGTLTAEVSLDSKIEFIPYAGDKDFKVIEQGDDWSVGAFITRVLKPETEQTKALAFHWQITPQKPVRYIITGQPSAEIATVIKEGLEYWNRVAGQRLLTVELSPSQDLAPEDQTVIVRWVPLKGAAKASSQRQYNPSNGRILRGQIFIPSVWKDQTVMQENYRSVGPADKEGAERAVRAMMLDDLRRTVAHEAGHTLGLRHNFAATAVVQTPIEKIMQAMREYTQDPLGVRDYPEMTSSVMDYPMNIEDALIGHTLLSKVFAYDADFIQWLYLGKTSPSSVPDNFCSDEHIAYATEEKLTVFGCREGKEAGLPLPASLKALSDSDQNALDFVANSLLDRSVHADGKIEFPLAESLDDVSYARIFEPAAYKELANMLFSAKNKAGEELNIIASRGSITKILVSGDAAPTKTSQDVSDSLASEWQSLLGAPERRALLLPVRADGTLEMLWKDNFLTPERLQRYRTGTTFEGLRYAMTDEQFKTFVAILAPLANRTLKNKLLAAPLRLLLQKEALADALTVDKEATIEYRDWLDPKTLTTLLKPYVAQLLTSYVGLRNVGGGPGTGVFASFGRVSVPDYVMTANDLVWLQGALASSGLQLGLDTRSVITARLQSLQMALSKSGVLLDGTKPIEDLQKIFEDGVHQGRVNAEVASWARGEFAFLQTLQKIPSL